MNYERDTRFFFFFLQIAQRYKNRYSHGISWMYMAMAREKRCVEKALGHCILSSTDVALDIPCGTGFIADVLLKRGIPIVAADISREMMSLAVEDYEGSKFTGFVEADITSSPFRKNAFECVLVLGLMHRVPEYVKEEILKDIATITNKYLIMSFSETNFFQRLKLACLKMIKPAHKPSAYPLPIKRIFSLAKQNGWEILKVYRPIWYFSSDVVFLLKKCS